MHFIFKKTEIEDVVLIQPEIFNDNRGTFFEFYKESEFLNFGIADKFVQDNFSFSKKNVLRGLHFQKQPHSQAKLIKCIKGKIIDVVVDLRKNSKTYKKYFKTELSDENNNILYIPQNFAHGFICLDDAIVCYKTTKEYSKECDCGFLWSDDEIGIEWGIDFVPIISEKDASLPLFCQIENLITESNL